MILLIIVSVFLHWFGDFVLQTDYHAKNKSTNNKVLISHTLIYSSVWLVSSLFYGCITMSLPLGIVFAIKFSLITFIAHTITDYFTSRLNTKLYNQGDIHNFFVSIGFDQALHYTQLCLTFYLLTK